MTRDMTRNPSVTGPTPDPVVKGTTWDAASGTETVPARTVAVLVQH